MPLDDALIYALITAVAIIACAIIIYAMKKRGGKEEKSLEKEETKRLPEGFPFKIVKSISPEEAAKAKNELRILDLEREILSDAIRKLYEAHAEGKITEEERERLAQAYKTRMMTIKEAIAKDESLVALHELESMQEDLIKLFSERFDELNEKIEELRSRVEAKPIKEIPVPTPKTQAPVPSEKPTTKEKGKKRKKKPTVKTPKTEAEKRIEQIRAEVEKVLERLGQMEVET